MNSPSPYVRRLRLGAQLRQLRKRAGISSADSLAKKVGVQRVAIVRLETGDRNRKIDLEEIATILHAVGVQHDSTEWHQILKVARDASEVGWWRSSIYRGMGQRQVLAAELEAGARLIQTYEPTLIPGLLQVGPYARALARALQADGVAIDTDATASGRTRRQEQIEADGTKLEILLEEIAVRRIVAPQETMLQQMQHLLDCLDGDRVDLRILPPDANMIDARAPREGFMLMHYHDPADPAVALRDAVTDDVVLTDTEELGAYQRLFDRCRNVALSPADSRHLITKAAETMAATSPEADNTP